MDSLIILWEDCSSYIIDHLSIPNRYFYSFCRAYSFPPTYQIYQDWSNFFHEYLYLKKVIRLFAVMIYEVVGYYDMISVFKSNQSCMSNQKTNLYQFALVVNGADISQICLSVQQLYNPNECNHLSLSIDLSTTREHSASDLEERENAENINSFGFA